MLGKPVYRVGILGADNSFEIRVREKKDGEIKPLPFDSVTKIELTVEGVTIQSLPTDNIIDWSQGGGKLVFNFSTVTELQPTSTEVIAEIRVFDPQHPNGQFISLPEFPSKVFLKLLDRRIS